MMEAIRQPFDNRVLQGYNRVLQGYNRVLQGYNRVLQGYNRVLQYPTIHNLTSNSAMALVWQVVLLDTDRAGNINRHLKKHNVTEYHALQAKYHPEPADACTRMHVMCARMHMHVQLNTCACMRLHMCMQLQPADQTNMS